MPHLSALADAVTNLLCAPLVESVTVEPDLRAHAAPSRAEVIRSRCVRLAKRLATGCPACGSATSAIAADILGCGQCAAVQRIPRATASVTPEWCEQCNP